MLRRLQAFLVLGVLAASVPTAAQESNDESMAGDPLSDEANSEPAAPAEPAMEAPSPEPADEAGGATQTGIGFHASGDASAEASSDEIDTDGSASAEASAGADEPGVDAGGEKPEPAASAPEAESAAAKQAAGWDTFITGYFRAPMAIGFSPRPGPDDQGGSSSMQMSYGPNRTIDANYYSFAYTRLQEQDWVELFVHAKKKHIEAVVGWLGYWLQSAGFRNYDAAWAPGMAYLTLDSDFDVAGLTPNIALTGGAWWPGFGYVKKYDTYTLGRFRQVGEQLTLTIPFSPDFKATLFQGLGTSRDGSFNILAPPPYQAQVGLNLLHYEHLELAYKKSLKVGLHYNRQWTRDPNLFPTTAPGKAFTDAKKSYLSTVGGEVTLDLPYAGSLWISPSYLRVRNGWALGEAGVEVMHSLSADSLATNYMGWSGSLSDSTGSGSMFNLGFLYENTLSGIQGKPRGSAAPEVTLNIFGLFADIKRDLPEGSVIGQDHAGQFKYGADVEVQVTDWLGVMLRWDEVNYNLGHAGYAFSAISPRVTFSSHFLSGESIYFQYSRYRYGDAMKLAGQWPWGTPLVAGSEIIQGGPYADDIPDMDVLRMQASIAF
jgi:hypothetical protein